MKINLVSSTIKFEIDDKPIEFIVYHNIGVFGNINTLEAAIQSWLVRTDKYTAKNLCNYINAKRERGLSNDYCFTEKEYKKLNSAQ